MSLEDKISSDYVQAMKARDSFASSVLSFLRAQIKNVKVDKRLEKVSDEDVISVIKKQVKQHQDSIEQFRAGNRLDLVAKEEAELKYLQQFLPEQMGDEELRALVVRIAGTETDAGRLMRPVLAEIAGRADARRVSTFVREHCDNAKRH